MDERPPGARDPWPDAAGAERLLGGAPADPRDAADVRFAGIVRLLTAVARDTELDPVRERAALAAFRAARSPGQRRAEVPKPAWPARALAGGLVAAFAVGGVAVAAGAGVLPGPFRGGEAVHAGALPPQTASAVTSPPRVTDDPRLDAGPPTATVGTGPATPSATPDARTSATATPSGPTPAAARKQRLLRALCRAYEEAVGQGTHLGRKHTNQLKRAAGRKDLIAAYCRTLLAAPPPPSAPARAPETTLE